MTPEERLRWLETNAPKNTAAINAAREALGLEPLPAQKVSRSHKARGLRITPYMHWRNRGTSSN